MNILFISPNSPEESVGGIERYIKNLVTFCTKRQDSSIFLLPRGEKENLKQEGNIKIYREEFLSSTFRGTEDLEKVMVSQEELQKKAKDSFNFLLSLFKNNQIDIVSAQNFHLGVPPAHSLMLNMACFSSNIPVVLQVHSFAEKTIHEEIINQLLWEKIICVSKSVAGDCFQKGADINKLTTNYLGVNTEEFKENSDKTWLKNRLNLPKSNKVILCASRIVRGPKEILKEKGILNLVEAFSKLAHRYGNLKLVVAMGVPPRPLMKEFNKSLEKLKGFIKLQGVEGRVICEKFRLDEMPLVYAGSDIFVLPSENETLGQVYIEAMACGVPVIGTKVGGVPEIISDNYNGLLVQPNDATILAQKIEELLNNQGLRKKYIKRGLKTARTKFSAERQLNNLFKYFEDLIGKNTKY